MKKAMKSAAILVLIVVLIIGLKGAGIPASIPAAINAANPKIEATDYKKISNSFKSKYKTAKEEIKESPKELGYMPAEVLVVFKDGVSAKKAEDTLKKQTEVKKIETDTGKVVAVVKTLKNCTVEETIKKLNSIDNIMYVQPNYIYTLLDNDIKSVKNNPKKHHQNNVNSIMPILEDHQINDTESSEQWHLDAINVDRAWDTLNNTSPMNKVRVAVLDTGLEMNHPDLQENINHSLCVDVTQNKVDGHYPSLIGDLGSPSIPHGTHVAGIIAATSNNSMGVTGVASGYNNDIVEVMAVKVFSFNIFSGLGAYTEDVVKGINYAVENDAKVINMSLGGSPSSIDIIFQETVNDANANGVSVVCAAGNSNNSVYSEPSDFDGAISVIATGISDSYAKDSKAYFSSYGEKKDISAPGIDILSTVANNGYAKWAGTSMASPIVAGVVALMYAANPNLSTDDVKEILYDTARDEFYPGFDTKTANGLVDAGAAVILAKNIYDSNPTPDLSDFDVTGITLNHSSLSLTTGDEGQALTAVVSPAGASMKKVIWTSSNTAVASVDADGIVSPVAPGTATITCTPKGNHETTAIAACTVTVTQGSGNGGTAVNSSIFPNEKWREFVLFNFDLNNDGYLSNSEKTDVTELFGYFEGEDYHGKCDVKELGITNFQGIEFFTSLTTLDCSDNNLTALDVSDNTALSILYCRNINLTALDLTDNAALTILDCSNNNLSALGSLDVSSNTSLTELFCLNDNLTALDVASNEDLTILDCESNRLAALDVTGNDALTTLYCNDNKLTELDLSGNTLLTDLDCSNNNMETLDLSQNDNLDTFFYGVQTPTLILDYMSGDYVVELTGTNYAPARIWGLSDGEATNTGINFGSTLSDVPNEVTYHYYTLSPDSDDIFVAATIKKGALIDAEYFPDNNWRSFVSTNYDINSDGYLSVQEAEAVTSIDISNQSIADLTGMEYFKNLLSLDCSDNNLTALNLSSNTALTTLDCSDNKLATLDVSSNDNLTEFTPGSQSPNLNVQYINGEYTIELAGTNYSSTRISSLSAGTAAGNGINFGSSFFDIPDTVTYSYDTCWPGSGIKTINVTASVTNINSWLFTDNNWRSFVSTNYDTDSDGYLSEQEAEAVISIDVSSQNITDLTGIEYFTELEELDCSSNNLTALDLTCNTALTVLDCSNNSLTVLDVSGNTALTDLNCSSNKLSTFDVSSNVNLTNFTPGSQSLSFRAQNDSSDFIAYLTGINYSPVRISSLSAGTATNDGIEFGQTFASVPDTFTYSYDTCWAGSGTKTINVTATIINKDVAINNVHFPDNNWRSRVSYYDSNNNGFLSEQEANLVTIIQFHLSSYSLKGIEYFINLGSLDCSNNKLTTLDVSANSNLTYFTPGSQSPNLNVQNINGDYIVELTGTNFSASRISNLSAGTATSTGINFGPTFSNVPDTFTYSYDTCWPGSGTKTIAVTATIINKGIAINSTNFPDSAWRSYVSTHYDVNSNGYLSSQETDSVTNISINNLSIANLTGIRYFKNITSLDCSNNNLTTLSVVYNTALTELDCSSNNLNNIQMSYVSMPSLSELNCSNNNLTDLYLGLSPALTELDCSDNNLTGLDVSGNPLLTELDCSNNSLTTLDVSGNTSLTDLDCSNNQMIALDVSSNSNLVNFTPGSQFPNLSAQYVNGEYKVDLTETAYSASRISNLSAGTATSNSISFGSALVNVPSTLTYSYNTCWAGSGTKAISVTASINYKGITIGSSDNFPDSYWSYFISSNYDDDHDGYLSLQEAEDVTSIDVSGQSIADLTGINFFTNLEELDCSGNNLIALDLSDNTALTELNCDDNKLATIDVSANSSLVNFTPGTQNPDLIVQNIDGEYIIKFADSSYSISRISNLSAGTAISDGISFGSTLANIPETITYSYNTCWPGTGTKTISVTATITIGVAINSANFPDDSWRLWVSLYDYDGNGYLFADEMATVTSIHLYNSLEWNSNGLDPVADLTGIEYFTQLEYLDCSNNNLTALDLSMNTALTRLLCNKNSLTTLNVSSNTALAYLNCSNNKLATLNVSSNSNLTSFIPGSQSPDLIVRLINGEYAVQVAGAARISNLSAGTVSSIGISFGPTFTNVPNTLAYSYNTNWPGTGTKSIYVTAGLTYSMVVDDFSFTVSDNKATITGYNGSGGNVVIPNTLIGYPVSAIGANAFENCTTVTGVTIGNNVINIGDFAFGSCSNLNNVTFGSGVKSIGEYAFQLTGLTSLTIPDSVTEMGQGAFSVCSDLASLTIGSGLETIGDYMFAYCTNLMGVNIPFNITGIDYRAFYNCTGLTDVNIGGNVTVIGTEAFQGCTGLENFFIPESVKTIDYNAFWGCTELTDVIIGSGVETINDYAFYNCTNLANAYFLGNAPTLGDSAFLGCPTSFKVKYIDGKTGFTSQWYGGTKEIFSPLDTPYFDLSSDDIGFDDVTVTITYPSNATVVEYSLLSDGEWLPYTSPVVLSKNDTVYARCKDSTGKPGLTGSIVIDNIAYENGLTYSLNGSKATITGYIGSGGNVIIPEKIYRHTVTSIDAGAFEYCTTIISIEIPDSVTYIGDLAFNGCSGLTVMNIGSGLNPENDFLGECTGLTHINISEENPYLSSRDGVVFNKAGTTLVKCPQGRTGNYEIPDGVTDISDGSFVFCAGLTSVTIPASVQSIGEAAFYNCTGIISVTFEEGSKLTDIGLAAFAYTGLTGVTIPAGVQSLGEGAFAYCDDLSSVTFEEESLLNSIGDSAFMGCTDLEDITLPALVTEIGQNAFTLCTSLTEANIPANVKNIENYVFAACNSLTTINVDPDNLYFKDIGGVLFNKTGTVLLSYPNARGNTYNIPYGVHEIRAAFAACESLTDVYIPDSVTNIGLLAFYMCSGLTHVTIPASVNNFDFEAFAECNNLASVYFLGDAVTNTDTSTFENCASGLTIYYVSGNTTFTNPWHGYTTAAFTPLDTPEITASTPVNGVVTVTIDYPEDAAVKLYKVGSGGWTAYTEVVELTANDTVYARCEDENGKPGYTGSLEVSSITNSEDFTYTVADGNATITGYTGEGGNVAIPGTLGEYEYPVTGIGANAFARNTELTKVYIPAGVTDIAAYAFGGNSSLTAIKVATSNSDYTSINGVLFDDTGATLIACPGGKSGYYSVPTGVAAIGEGAFAGCAKLTGIGFNDVETVGGMAFFGCSGLTGDMTIYADITYGIGAFAECTGLTSVTVEKGEGNDPGVTSIPESLFYGCSGLTSVDMKDDDDLTSIGYFAFFGCLKLPDVILPENVDVIRSNAFAGSLSLSSIYFLGDAPTTVEFNAFGWDNPTVYYLSGSTGYTATWNGYMTVPFYIDNPYYYTVSDSKAKIIKFIGTGAAIYLEIPDTLGSYPVTGIGGDAFTANSNLTAIIIPASVTDIEAAAFTGCTNLYGINVNSSNEHYKSVDGVLFNKAGTTLVAYPGGLFGPYTIPDGVTTIADNAFTCCPKLTKLTISESVSSIGNLEFLLCDNLMIFNVAESNTHYSSLYGVLFNKEGTTLIAYPGGRVGAYTVPTGVTDIGENAFIFSTHLTEIDTNGVTNIGNMAFLGCGGLTGEMTVSKDINYGVGSFGYCTGLTGVTVDKDVESIPESMFYGCAGLTSVNMMGDDKQGDVKLESIGDLAFFGCIWLPKVDIPASVDSIGFWSFAGSMALTEVYCYGNAPSAPDMLFGWDNSAVTVYYISGNTGFTNPWHGYTTATFTPDCDFEYSITDGKVTITGYHGDGGDVEIPPTLFGNDVISIDAGAFENCIEITEVTIPDSVTYIGDSAFNGCNGLTVMEIGSGFVPQNDFIGVCSALTHINISQWNPYLLSIDGVVFDKAAETLFKCPMGKTDSYEIPESVTNINGGAFYGCSKLTSVTFEEGSKLTGIGDGAFAECTGLTGITIPDNVQNLGNGAFYDCTELNSVVIPASVKSIGGGAFASCTGLSSVTFEEESLLDSIGDSAFMGCTVLDDITLPALVTEIGQNAFTLCTSLTEANIPANVKNIENYVFAACNSLTTINVDPDNLYFKDIGGVLFNKTGTVLLSYPNARGNTYNIPYGVHEIRAAFAACESLTDVYIPDSVTNIGLLAFYMCSGLTHVTIPASVSNFDFEAFAECNNLASVYFLGDAVTNTDTSTFENCASGLTIYYVSGNTTFTNPWHGYTTAAFTPLDTPEITASTPVNGVVTDTIDYPEDAAVKLYKVGSGAWTATYTGVVELTDNDTVYARCEDENGKPSCTESIDVSSIIHPEDFTYTESQGNATITGYTGEGGNVAIPGTLGGYPVTGIGENVFTSNAALTKVYIPASVTDISAYTFGDNSSLIAIDVAASNQNYASTNGVLFNEAGTTLVAYPGGKSGTYSVPAGVAEIGENAFAGCANLLGINIPSSVTTIGGGAFFGCTGLTGQMSISANVTYGVAAYAFCTGLTSVYVEDGVESIPESLFYNCTGLNSVNLKDDVDLESIGYYAFFGCLKLPDVTLPENVDIIRYGAFAGGLCLSSVYFLGDAPATVEDIAFGWNSPTVYYLDGNTGFTNPWHNYPTVCVFSDDSYFYTVSNSEAKIIKYQGTGGWITIPNTLNGYAVTGIGNNAFTGNSNVTIITIPAGITNIEDIAFAGCFYLNEFYVDSSNPNYKSIDGVLFNKAGTTLVAYPGGKSGPYSIPEGVVTINDNAFTYVRYLSSVHIPASVTGIANGSFIFGENLMSINVDPDNPDYSSRYGVLFNKAGTTLIAYPGGRVGPYTVPTGATKIDVSAFIFCTKLTGITIPSGVTNIADCAFFGCSGLTGGMTVSSGVTYGVGVFGYCTGLTGVTVDEGVGSIPESMFYGCSGLTGLDMMNDDDLASIGDLAFFGSIWLSSVEIPENVESIGYWAFAANMSLSEVYLYGDAPAAQDMVFGWDNSAVTVYYISGNTGFTNPWHGYTTATFMPSLAPTISASTTLPTSGNVTITITYPTAATVKEYKIGTGAWTAYTTDLTIPFDNTVYARCTDANGNPSPIVSTSVNNIVKLKARNGSTTVIDQTNHFIYALEEGMTKSDFEEKFVKIQGNGKLVYTYASNSFGTGTTVELIDKITNTVVETYYIVIFGDVNGDGSINESDEDIIGMVASYQDEFEPDSPFEYAADLTQDEVVDGFDWNMIRAVTYNLALIDQTNPSVLISL